MLGSCSLIEAKGVFSVLFPPSFSEKGNRVLGAEAFFWSKLQVGGVLEAPCSCKLQAICNHSFAPLPFYFNSFGFGLSPFDLKGRSID